MHKMGIEIFYQAIECEAWQNALNKMKNTMMHDTELNFFRYEFKSPL